MTDGTQVVVMMNPARVADPEDDCRPGSGHAAVEAAKKPAAIFCCSTLAREVLVTNFPSELQTARGFGERLCVKAVELTTTWSQ